MPHLKAALAAARRCQSAAHGTIYRIKDIALSCKANLRLGGVYVDIHQVGGHRQHQHAAGELALHNGTLVGVFERCHHRAVFDIASVHKKVLCAAAGTAGTRRRDKPRHTVQFVPAVHVQQIAGKFPPQHRVHGAAQAAVTGGDKLLLAVLGKAETDFRVGERRVQHGFGNKGPLAGILFEELHPRRGVVKQVVDRNGRTYAARARLDALFFPAGNAVNTGKLVVFGAGHDLHTRHACNGSQCLPAKAQRVDMPQIIRRGNFAGCMADKRLVNVLRFDAAAVIHDLQLMYAAALDGKADLRCPGIDGVFQQFLCHRSRALYDLARSDQFCRMLVQHTNFRHEIHLPLVFVQCGF